MIRLNRYLALCGIASRRKSEAFIKAGRVKLNGKVSTDLSIKVDQDSDIITLDDRICKPAARFDYILLNKPAGVVTSAADEYKRKTVIDIIPIASRIFPVGRLDMDTEGVLLLTNDGELAQHLIHPKFEIDKTYIAALNKPFSTGDLNKLISGIQLDDGPTKPCTGQILIDKQKGNRVKITIHEGRKRQVKRMFSTLGYKVQKLQRTCFAGLYVDDLKPGQWRYLTEHELNQLRRLIGKSN